MATLNQAQGKLKESDTVNSGHDTYEWVNAEAESRKMMDISQNP